MTATPLPDGTLAGYRLVRRLGSGSRADVYLGVGSTGSVALKVFQSATTRESIDAELDALGRIESPHLVRLLDVSDGLDGVPILILERVGRLTVATLLRQRESIECGEAVTLLAPVAGLVAALAGVGVGHGGISPSSLQFGSQGEPVLLGLGHCQLFESGATMAVIDQEPAAAIDRDALASLTLGVLARVRSDDASARVSELVEWIENAPRAFEFPIELAERLFACAEPLPIAMVADPIDGALIPARTTPVHAPVRTPVSARVPVAEPVEVPTPPPSRLPAWLPELVLENPIGVLKKRAIAFARGVRPRFWVIAAGAAVALILAAVLIPSGSTQPSVSATPVAAPSEEGPSASPSPLADDPVQAAKVLLERGAACLRNLSILCLDGVDEGSSAAFTRDAAAIQRIQQGGEQSPSSIPAGVPLTLVERLGDTALIAIGDPVSATSILIIRDRTGWRIRDELNGHQATPTP